MIGRAAVREPYMFAEIDQVVFGSTQKRPSRADVVHGLIDYVGAWETGTEPLGRVLRHAQPLFAGQRGARVWRQSLAQAAGQRQGGVQVLQTAAQSLGLDFAG